MKASSSAWWSVAAAVFAFLQSEAVTTAVSRNHTASHWAAAAAASALLSLMSALKGDRDDVCNVLAIGIDEPGSSELPGEIQAAVFENYAGSFRFRTVSQSGWGAPLQVVRDDCAFARAATARHARPRVCVHQLGLLVWTFTDRAQTPDGRVVASESDNPARRGRDGGGRGRSRAAAAAPPTWR